MEKKSTPPYTRKRAVECIPKKQNKKNGQNNHRKHGRRTTTGHRREHSQRGNSGSDERSPKNERKAHSPTHTYTHEHTKRMAMLCRSASAAVLQRFTRASPCMHVSGCTNNNNYHQPSGASDLEISAPYCMLTSSSGPVLARWPCAARPTGKKHRKKNEGHMA